MTKKELSTLNICKQKLINETEGKLRSEGLYVNIGFNDDYVE